MNRKKIEDIKLNNNKVITIPKEDIPKKIAPSYINTYIPPENSTKYDFLKKINKNTESFTQRIPQTPKMPSSNSNFGKKFAAFVLLLIIAGSIYLLSTVFFKAKVTIIPKVKSFDLSSQKFTAGKFKTTNVPFEVMIVPDVETKDVVLTTTLNASDKAKGEITLYNEYSTKPQKISAGTFISDDKGKSYKTDTTVTIPALTKDNSKIIPGQIPVKITAFLSGDTYNGSPDSFYINSYKGTTKYEKIYGKIKTPLSGGVAGLVYVLDDKEKEGIISDTTALNERLLRKLSAQIPEGYIYYPDGVSFVYEFSENITSKTPVAKIEIKSTVSTFLFKETDLSNFLINKLLPDISDKEKSEILPPDLSKLTFSFADKGQAISKDIENFNFELSGNLIINWKPNVDELKGLLIGKNKNEVPAIFKLDPGISSASISIIPFWSSKLPNEVKNINILFK